MAELHFNSLAFGLWVILAPANVARVMTYEGREPWMPETQEELGFYSQRHRSESEIFIKYLIRKH